MIIGLMGKAGAGKDTVANMLEGLPTSTPVRIDALANPLYAGLSVMLDIDEDALRNRDTKETVLNGLGKSPRQLLQTLGTEWGRECVHADIWARLALQRHQRATFEMNERIVTIITDVRFDNEVDVLKRQKHGCLLVHIERPGNPSVSEHVSEIAVDYEVADLHLLNHGGLDLLHETVVRDLGPFVGSFR